MTTEALELELQRLADGELDQRRVSDLLRLAENRPGIWREMALVFVEQQAMGRALSQFVGDTSSPAPEDGEVLPAGTAMSAANCDWGSGTTPAKPVFWMSANVFWLSAAAALLLVMPLGYWLGIQQGAQFAHQLVNHVDRSVPLASVEAPVNNVPPVISTADRLQQVVAPYKIRLVSENGEPLVDEEIPLIPHTLAVEMGLRLPQIEIPEVIQVEYRQAGLELQPRVRLLSGRMNDGRQVVVPVQDLTLVAYGQ